MTVFRTFLRVLNKLKPVVIMYTVILIVFGGLNMKQNDTGTTFTAEKPDVLIINNDIEEGVTKNLIDYIKSKSNIVNIKNNEEAINDALFYRDVNYIIIIPKNYKEDFLQKRNPKIEIKSTGDYQASLAELTLKKYIETANVYNEKFDNEDEIISNINKTLEKESSVELTTKLDTSKLSRLASFYNFANYSILAGCVYVICLILSIFKEEKIKKRTLVSSMNYKKYNFTLLLSNALFTILLYIVYIILGVVLLGDSMFTLNGLFFAINLLVLTICALTMAFLIGNVLSDKNAINGIVNVIALGSSFLCGSFVPVEFLPDTVLKVAHILPSYYYVQNNEMIKTIESFNLETLTPVLINMGIILIFATGFVIITNIVARSKQKIS